MTGQEPRTIDHRNGVPDDNRWANLRAANVTENRRNTSGFRGHPLPKGVHHENGRFTARGYLDGRKKYLGAFDTPAEAHDAWCAWARPIHGEFFNPGPEKPSIFD